MINENNTTRGYVTDLGDDYVTITLHTGEAVKVRWWAIPAASTFIGAAVYVVREYATPGGFTMEGTREAVEVNAYALAP